MQKRKIFFPLVVGVLLLFSWNCGKKMTEDDYLQKARDYEQNEEYEKAAEVYLGLFKKFPSGEHGAEALFKAALIQANQLQQFNQAIETHKRLMRAFPDSRYYAQSLFMIGYIYANNIKDYDKARENYNAFLEKFPNHELVASVKWELENLGKDIDEIDFLKATEADSSTSH